MQIKKIQTKDEKEKKDKKNQLTIGIILISLMIFSTAGYAFSQNKVEKKVYNGVSFVKTEGYWNSETPFLSVRYLPYDVGGINGSVFISANSIDTEKFYFSAHSSYEFAAADDVARNLFFQKSQQICLEGQEEKTGCENLPIKSCTDNSTNFLIFVFQLNNTTVNLEKRDKCIFFSGEGENLIKVADKFIFNINNIF
jgi:hypothetical protein